MEEINKAIGGEELTADSASAHPSHQKTPVILSERSESKDLPADLPLWVSVNGRSFDFISLRSIRAG